MSRWPSLPLPVVLMAIAGVLMYIPALHGLTIRALPVARAFFYAGTLVLLFTLLLALVVQLVRRVMDQRPSADRVSP